jgi:predicted DNA-binding transcriptional regulator AlpA
MLNATAGAVMKNREHHNVSTPEQTPVAVLRAEPSATYIGVSLGKLWKLVKAEPKDGEPQFPQPFKLGPTMTVFWVRELDAWLEAIAARNVASKAELLKQVRAEREAKRAVAREAEPLKKAASAKRKAKRTTSSEHPAEAA